MVVRIFLDAKNARARLENLMKKFRPTLVKETEYMANTAKAHAKAGVPKDTRTTEKAIIDIVKYSGDNFIRAEVGFKKVNIPHYGRTKPFVLPYWMTFSDQAMDGWWAYGRKGGKWVHFTNGSPRFLLETQEMIRRRFGKQLQLRIRDLINKT